MRVQLFSPLTASHDDFFTAAFYTVSSSVLTASLCNSILSDRTAKSETENQQTKAKSEKERRSLDCDEFFQELKSTGQVIIKIKGKKQEEESSSHR